MSSEEGQPKDLAAARREVEEGRQRVKDLTEDLAEAMAVNNNKQAGALHRDCQKAKRKLERAEETLRALEEGQRNKA